VPLADSLRILNILFVCLFVFCFRRFVQIVEDENQFFGSWPAFMKIFLEIYHNVGSKLIFSLSLTFFKEYEISFWVLIFFKNVLFVLLGFFFSLLSWKIGFDFFEICVCGVSRFFYVVSNHWIFIVTFLILWKIVKNFLKVPQ